MQLKIVDVENIPKIERVLLFTEDQPEDYIFSHLLCLVEDREEKSKVFARAYRELPDSVLITERHHFLAAAGTKLLNVAGGNYERQTLLRGSLT